MYNGCIHAPTIHNQVALKPRMIIIYPCPAVIWMSIGSLPHCGILVFRSGGPVLAAPLKFPKNRESREILDQQNRCNLEVGYYQL